MKTPKTDQLRVRLTSVQRAALERMLKHRGQNETLSDLVREIIDQAVSPDARQIACRISRTVYERVAALAGMLNRETDQVIEQSLENICDVIDRPEIKVPLILVEHQLRREYQQKRGPSAEGEESSRMERMTANPDAN